MNQDDFKINKNLLHFLSNNLGWKDFNPIQKKAIPYVLNGTNTLILAPTASGKTEAALIPIFSDILNNHLKPVSVLYISPLKALINDMHHRVEKWGNHFGLSSTKWHGDVSRYEKDKFTKNPTDFLLTTPESLEVILMNRSGGEKKRVFNNIKYILIDEIHYFADSDRGIQLNSILNRISKYASNASIIGLSATVGNPDLIAKWISPYEPAKIVSDDSGRKLQYKVFGSSEHELSNVLSNLTDKKVLIFANSRRTAELSYYNLKKNININNIFIHHGSINKETREENEDKFKSVKSAFIVATNTLELGIDIGDIDMVVQLSAPSQVSSFSQRIGRSGRRSMVQRTILISQGFNLLISLAELILHHENKVEQIKISDRSTDILFHQILSVVFEKGNPNFKEVYNELKGCYAFSGITFNDFLDLLKEMSKHDLININNNFLTLGYSFEKNFGQANYKNFYAVFSPSFEYAIYEGNKEIGTLDIAYAVDLKEGDQFNLAGKLWRVNAINHKNYKVYVSKELLTKAKIPNWNSGGAPVSPLIANKIYEILQGKFEDKFLNPFDDAARQTIIHSISNAQLDGFGEGILPVELNKNKVVIYTFAGDKANKLLLKIFEMYYDVYNTFTTPIYTSFIVKDEINSKDIESVIYDLENILSINSTEAILDNLTSTFKKNKFMEYLPEEVRGQLKMNLLFDKEALIEATIDKKINFIVESKFRKNLFRYEKEEHNEIEISQSE
ncbi:DEAD/DEAH box helicase [Methanobrevibacter sp.]